MGDLKNEVIACIKFHVGDCKNIVCPYELGPTLKIGHAGEYAEAVEKIFKRANIAGTIGFMTLSCLNCESGMTRFYYLKVLEKISGRIEYGTPNEDIKNKYRNAYLRC